MKTSLFAPLAIAAFSLQVLPTQAALTGWRTQVQASNGGNGPPLTFAFDGGLNDPSSAVTLSRSGVFSQASSQLAMSGYIPTLRTLVTNTGTRGQAVAWGVQGYTNTSANALNTALVLNLTATITGNNDLRASVYLFQDEGFEFSTGAGTILFESSSQLWPGFEDLANNLGPGGFDVGFNNHAGAVNEQRQFDFSVAPGDSFYVWAFMSGTADNPGVVDSFSTLTASFTNTAGLTPAVIPEPGSAALILVGALGLLRRRR